MYMRPLLDREHRIEQEKIKLSFSKDFSLAGTFNLFSGYSQARVSNTDFMLAAEQMGVLRECDQTDAALIVNRFDQDEDNTLSFWEFANLFLPAQQSYRDELERRLAVWDLSP